MDDKILEHIHEQFAINQNDHDKRFITFFVALLALFGIYGFVYSMYFCWIKDEWFVQIQVVYCLSIIVGIVLSYFIILTLLSAKNFRRDQFLNDRIRFFSIGNNEKYKLFFENYSGVNKNCLEFIPDYLKIRLYFLFANLIIVLISVIFLLLSPKTPKCKNFDFTCFFICIIILFALLFYCIYNWKIIFKKYQDLSDKHLNIKANNSPSLFSIENLNIQQNIHVNQNENPEEEEKNSIIRQSIEDNNQVLNNNNSTIQQTINLNFKK